MIKYNAWPIGKVPKELQRVELEQVRQYIDYDDPRDIVNKFEEMVADFCGSSYAVSVDCCTHALELSLRLKMVLTDLSKNDKIKVPEHTYVSVPMVVRKCGLKVEFTNEKWEGSYTLSGGTIPVIDSAVRWRRNMYIPGSLMCLSFQIKKAIPIGKGGIILTNNKTYYEILKLMSYDGRDLNTPYDSEEHIKFYGYHYYMTPEDAARGIILMKNIDKEGDFGSWVNYPNLRQWLKEH